MLSVVRFGFGVLVLLKAIDLSDRGSRLLPLPLLIVLVVLWVAAAGAILTGRLPRIGAGVIAGVAVVAWVASGFAYYNQHLYLIVSIAVILAVGRSVGLLLRATLSIVYGFAALSKFNETFLAGDELYLVMVKHWFWQTFIGVTPPVWAMTAMALAVIGSEVFLAIAFWHRRMRWVALIYGIAFHGAMVIASTTLDPIEFVRLVVFGGLMVLLYAAFFEPELDRLVTRHPVLARRLAFRDLAPHHHHRLRPLGQQGSLRDARELDPDPR